MNTLDLSDKEISIARAEGAAAAIEFEESLSDLVSQLSSVDGLEIIARAGFALIGCGAGDVNRIVPARVEFFHVELIQALALSRPRGTEPPVDGYPDVTQRVLDLIELNTRTYRDRAKTKIDRDARENRRSEMLTLVRNWTLAVRGVRHDYQTREYAKELAATINASFMCHFGCEATQVVATMIQLVEETERRLQAHWTQMLSWCREKSGIRMIDAFTRGMGSDEALAIRRATMPFRSDRGVVRSILWDLCEQHLVELFTFDVGGLINGVPEQQQEPLRHLIGNLSLRFGEVIPEPLEHLHLDNPIRRKPFVVIDERRVFCGLPQLLGGQLAELLEALCATRPTLKRDEEKARAAWLERKLASVVRRFLPHADVYESVSLKDCRNGESDLVAIIDQTILVFEAKSAKIKAAARRGGPKSLKQALTDLVVEPSKQSLRFKNWILNADAPLEFETRSGQLIIDPSTVREIIRINIMQDAVGPLSSHWPQLKEVDLIPQDQDIAPSMSIFDLESVFQVLNMEIERCHYLSRRAELERNCSYVADELDLLSLYVRTQFNLGQDEFSVERHQWYGILPQITPTYCEKRSDCELVFPIKRTEFWKRLLMSLECKRPTGWSRFGHRLLNVDFKGQRKVEQLLKYGFKKVKRNPGLFYTSGVTHGSSDRMETIAVMVGAPESEEQYQANIEYAVTSAFEQGGQQSLLALYSFVPKTGEPYDFIGTFRRGGTAQR